MEATGEPEDNGYAERLMRAIKEEEVSLTEYADVADARRQLGRFLDAVYTLVCTSATLTVFGQGFDFFLGRVGLEPQRLLAVVPPKTLVTHFLPHAFDYHNQALLMLPGDLPTARDTELKHNFPAAVSDLLKRFIPFFGGRSLALFTANSRRDYFHDHIGDPLTARRITGPCPSLIPRPPVISQADASGGG